MNPAPTVLVIGANGHFGQAAVNAFADAGWRVLAQVRRAPAAPLPPGVQVVTQPLHDPGALADTAAGARVVVHAANPPYTRWAEDLLPLARQALDLAERLGARFVMPGNVYAYGAGMPARLTEHTPPRPTTAKGRLRQALEDDIAARCVERGLRADIVRAGDFFGGGAGGWLDRVIAKGLGAGRLAYPGPLDVPHAWAYLPDLARAVVALQSRDAAARPGLGRWHFAGHTLTGAELLDALERAARRLGLAPVGGLRRSRMAWWPLQLAAPLWPMGRELLAMRYLWQVPHALDGAALECAIGPLRPTPIDDALVATLQRLGLGAAAGARHAVTA